RLIRKTTTRISRKPDVWQYRYNAFDQLTDVYTPEGQWWHYTYDALGRRTTKRQLTSGGATVQRIELIWEGTRLVENASLTSISRWSYLDRTHIPLTQQTSRSATESEFELFVTDLVGTPVELISINAQVTACATTDLWGAVGWRGASHTLLRFPGQQYDPESGLHYNLHRVYDPDSGRYLTQDPIGLAPSPNPSTYVLNPMTWTDPLGLTPCRNEDGSYQVRSPNPAYPPDPRLDELMNRSYHQNTDCSEIAEMMLERADGEGRIIRYEPADRFGAVGTPENLGRTITDYIYHEVYTDGRYVYDPAFSNTPVPLGDFHRIMKSLNPGIRW
ncbi:RHS repeat-associated core domain-containing protein, partial [Nocardia cyriacigeorgica]